MLFLHLQLAFSDLRFMWSLSAISSSQQYHFEDTKWAHLKGSQWTQPQGCSMASGQGPRTKYVTGSKPSCWAGALDTDHALGLSLLWSGSLLGTFKILLVSTSKNSNNVVRRVWCGPALSPAPTSRWKFLPQEWEITQQWRHTVDFLFLLKRLKLY